MLSSLLRTITLLASVALIAAFTLTPRSGDSLVQVSQLVDVVEALRDVDKGFLRDFLLEATANVLLFMPFGAALRLRGLSIRMTALSGFVLSAAVECAQWRFVPGRTTSLDDVVLNTFGAVLGHALLTQALRGTRARSD